MALGAARDPSWIEQCLPAGTPIVAASDYVGAVADLIRTWINDRYIALSADGFGQSDTRAALRRFFEVDRQTIAVAALSTINPERTPQAAQAFGLSAALAPPRRR